MSDQRPIPDPGTSPETLRQRARALPMRVATATFVTPTDERLRFIRQMGVTDIILWGTTFRSPRNPGGGAVSFKELVALRNQAEAHGLRVFAVETLPLQSYDKLIFGEEGREQQLQHYIETIRNTGRAGIPVLGYNWMPQGVWRTTLSAPLRGGASSTGFAYAEAENAPLIRGRRFTEEECWDNYAWFLERVLPVAEDEGVTLAAHPNDPPVESLGGVPCLLRSRANFDKALSIRPSKNHGLCFCLGNWTEMGEDIFDAIRHYGKQDKLIYVHFQAVRGRVPRFHETFVDEADYDAWALIRAFDEAGFKGVMIPGHVPEMEGDEPWRTKESIENTPYYHPMGGYRGRAYTVGYLRGLLHALNVNRAMIELRATNWNHVRGIAPLAAAAQVFSDRNPGVQIEVVPHSAAQFGEGPLDALTRDFDLVGFDHPLTGMAAQEGIFLPLDDHLPAAVLADRRENSVGSSYDSYVFDGKVWGLPLDAACIVSASRPDLIDRVPTTWDELLALAAEGRVAQGFSRMTTTAMFYMLRHQGFDESSAIEALRQLYRLTGGAKRMNQGSIQVLEAAASGEEIAFVPACYGYSNYTRPGFAACPLVFHPTPFAPTGGAVLGGAGIAVSAACKHPEVALQFLEWITGADCQTHIYAVCGGQPAHAAAWKADLPNSLTRNFFRSTMSAMETAWVRPTTPEFHHIQSDLATKLHAALTA